MQLEVRVPRQEHAGHQDGRAGGQGASQVIMGEVPFLHEHIVDIRGHLFQHIMRHADRFEHPRSSEVT